MKKLKNCIVTAAILILSHSLSAQKHDIPELFSATGFVEHVGKGNQLEVAFTINKEIVTKTVHTGTAQVASSDGKTMLQAENIHSNDEITVSGKLYKVDKFIEAEKIILAEKTVPAITDGRLDSISPTAAYIDGHRVVLAPGKKIKGTKSRADKNNKSTKGYEGTTFSALNELKEGDFTDVEGKYKEGYYVADQMSTSPEDVTMADRVADTVDLGDYNNFYPKWTNKSKRNLLLGRPIRGIGRIYNDAAVQDYVNSVGQKLIPAHIKNKIKFIFIVVENPSFNANVRANGLAYVYTGLLKGIDNEAQLAAVLGHEISHAIYEHISKESMARQNTDTGKSGVGLLSNIGKKLTAKKSKLLGNDEKEQKKAAVDQGNDAATVLAKSFLSLRLSTFSKEQELEADRVGLCLMALAGYDPREAPIVWKKLFEVYNSPEISTKAFKVIHTMEEVTAVKKPDPNAKDKPDPKDADDSYAPELAELGAGLMGTLSEQNTLNSYQTHPDNIKRFEELNRLISLYWNDKALLANAKTGTEKYASVMGKLKKRK